jgi:hypothetical protein
MKSSAQLTHQSEGYMLATANAKSSPEVISLRALLAESRKEIDDLKLENEVRSDTIKALIRIMPLYSPLSSPRF